MASTGKDIVFVTNNATKSRRQYKAKFDKLGIQASEVCPPSQLTPELEGRETRGLTFLVRILKEEIFGSAYASAVYLSTVLKFPKDKKVFVIGEAGLEEELKAEGINYCGGSVSHSSNCLVFSGCVSFARADGSCVWVW